jgi:hypothetical protein
MVTTCDPEDREIGSLLDIWRRIVGESERRPEFVE